MGIKLYLFPNNESCGSHFAEFCANIEDTQDEIRNTAINNFMVAG